jgi:hypothetical protein
VSEHEQEFTHDGCRRRALASARLRVPRAMADTAD